jgi:hypothetical protein
VKADIRRLPSQAMMPAEVSDQLTWVGGQVRNLLCASTVGAELDDARREIELAESGAASNPAVFLRHGAARLIQAAAMIERAAREAQK